MKENPKVTLIQVVYNSMKFIPPVFEAMLKQTYKNVELVAVISGNEDGGKEYIQEHFPQVRIIDPGYNIGFAKGHNVFFEESDSDYFQLVNPDLILEPNFVEEMLKAFEDPKVGATSGKLMQYNFDENRPTGKIDSTGVSYYKSGRGRDRGQHEEDNGQYDDKRNLIGSSGAGVMYSKEALEAVKMKREDGRNEYFDEDFHSYWEDVDLSLRMINAGYKILYVPTALAYHGRTAGSNPGGYKKSFSFVKFHKKMNPRIRQLNYKNHIFLFVKNSPKWYPQFFVRELFMHLYILVFETETFKAVPDLFKLLPKMLEKRKEIKLARKISSKEFEELLSK